MQEVICCEPTITTFLAETQVLPRQTKKFRRTEEEKRRLADRMVACLKDDTIKTLD